MLSFRVRRAAVLLWILVTIAVIAAVAAATAPLLMQINDTERVAASAQLLRGVARGVDSFNAVVARGASSSPSNTTPASLDATGRSPVASGGIAGCSAQRYDTASVTGWTANGPFAPYVMSPEGLWTPIGRVNDAPSRAPTAVQQRRAATDAYFIQIPGVDVKMARLLDVYVDGAANANADTVQYSSPARDSTVLLSYRVTLRRTPAC